MNFLSYLNEAYLTEAIIDNIIKQNPDMDASVIKHYNDNSLPADKKHLDWVVKQHKLGNITPADAHTLKPYLTSYMRHKEKIGDSIHKFDVDGLRDAVKRFTTDSNTKDIPKEDANTKVIHEDDDIIVKQHKGWESSAAMGKLPTNNPYHKELNGHASWCISLRGGSNKGYVNTYTEHGKHPIISIENKHTGRKHALVMNPNASIPEFRDEHDKRPNMREFLSQHPTIMGTKPGKFLENHFEDANDYIGKFEGKTLHSLTGGDIDHLYDKNQEDRTFTNGLMAHKNVHESTLVKDYHDNVNDSGNWHKGNFPALANKKFPSSVIDSEIDKGIDNAGRRLTEIATHAHLQPHHIDKLVNHAVGKEGINSYPEVAHALIENDNIKLSKEHQEKLLSNFGSVGKSLVSATTHPDIINHIVKMGNYSEIHKRALANPHLDTEGFQHIANNMNHDDHMIDQVMSHPKMTKEVAGKLLHSRLLSYTNNPSESINDRRAYVENLGTTTLTGNLIRKGNLPKESQRSLMHTLVDATNNSPYEGHLGVARNHLSNFFANEHLDHSVANEGYKMLSDANKTIVGNGRGKGIEKLNDENLKDAIVNHNQHRTAMNNVDFEKRPHIFDHINLKNDYFNTTNKTLQPHMLRQLHDNHAASVTDIAKHPNAPIDIQKSVSSFSKSNALHVLDRDNVSPELFKHVLNNNFSHDRVSVLRKLVSHQSVGQHDLSYALNKVNQPNSRTESPAHEKMKREVAHEVYKRRDELTNKAYNDLTKTSLHEKTMTGLLKDNITDEHLKNIISTNHQYFNRFENGTSNVRLPSRDMFEKIMKHPALGQKTLTHMMDNKDKYIPAGEENFVKRKLGEAQGQMSLQFPPARGKKK